MAIFNGLIDFVARILAFLYSLPVVGGNYGLAVMMLTLVVMVLLMPLTLKATRSTIKMQQIQPELRRLQKDMKDADRATLNAEVMKLYSENGISPVGGCLPMLAQLPVFLVLFRILQGLTRRIEDRPFFSLTNRLREAKGLEMEDGRFFDPQYLAQDSTLYQDLRADTSMEFGPFDLAERALDVLQSDFLKAIPYVILIFFVVGSSYYQQRQVSARRTTDDNAEVSPMMQQQQMLLKVLPLMSGIWSFLFPAGLVLYWATSNLFRIGQQSYITHQIYGKEAPVIEAEAKKSADARKKASDADNAEPADENGDSQSNGQSNKKKANGKAGNKTDKPGNKASDKAGNKANGKADKKTEKSSNDTESNGANADMDRNARWEQRRRQQRAKSKSAGKAKDEQASSRVTPKGTKSGPSKKKKR